MEYSSRDSRESRFSAVPQIIFPNERESLKEFICDSLCSIGRFQEGCFVRQISFDRVDFALRNGHDRDNTSNIDYFGNTDGESQAMIDHGLSPILDKHLVTYVSKLDWMHPAQLTPNFSCAYLVFRADALELIGGASNGFAKFTNRFSQQFALVAVFKTSDKIG